MTFEEMKALEARLHTIPNSQLGRCLYSGTIWNVIIYSKLQLWGGVPCYVIYKTRPDFLDVYVGRFAISNYETGESARLNSFIQKELTSLIAQEQREKEKQEAEEAAAHKERERQRYHGFTDGMTPMQKGRIVKCLDRKNRYEADGYVKGGIMTRAKWIEAMAEAGARAEIGTYRGRTQRRIYCRDNGFYVVTKIEYDYFQYMTAYNIPF